MTNETTKKATGDNTKRPSTPEKPQPVKVVRNGAIAASIWRRQTGTGFAYFDFSLSRSWKSTTSGKEGYSSNFFPQNDEALADVIRQASDWIVTQMVEADDPAKEPAAGVRKAA
jgi:hypothetical protein